MATAWEVVDVRVVGLQRLAARFNLESERLWQRLTLRREDAFMVNALLLNGVLLPLYFVVEGLAAREHGGIVLWRALLYNVLRFGPNVSNFAWVNTLVHKCCHGRLFRHRAMDSVFEFWVGNFYGIVPGNYSVSHIYNHHKHDNSLEDVITVIDFARDDMLGYVGYVWRYVSYTLNVSSAISFWNSGDVARCAKISVCTLFYLGFCLASARLFGAAFCLAYVIYPMAQGLVIISAINYTWHAFVQPGDEQNRLINSTTIVNGEYFILEEQYHAVHHLYAGVHWTTHAAMYERHKDDCKVPTRFYRLSVFELFAMIVLRDYAGLAANSGIDEQVLVARLRHTVQRELPPAAVGRRPA